MKIDRWIRVAAATVALFPLANCSSDGGSEKCAGAERCACYPNGTCDEGLACLSNTCVSLGSSGAGGGNNASGGSEANRAGAGDDENAGTGPEDAGETSTSEDGGRASGGRGNDPAAGRPSGGRSSGSSGSAGEVEPGGGATNSGDQCRAFETYPEATVPTVFVLVDRSGSMFSCLSTGTPSVGACPDESDTAWAALKEGTLETVRALEGDVRFGFGAFTGEIASECPMFEKVDAKLSNYDAIAEAYDGLGAPTKGETPTARVLYDVLSVLRDDPSPGEKYVLLVTDGEPDFCDDGSAICPVDATVAALQALHAEGVGTLVFGVDSVLSTISGKTLQAFANAGAGEPVAPLTEQPTIYDQCLATSGWLELWQSSGKASGSPLATYSTDGDATVFRPDPNDRQALSRLFQTAVSGVKSCIFDLASGLSVDLSREDQATVAIEGELIEHDPDNGWQMNSETQLRLFGDACTLWRNPDSRTIDFNFPCGVVVSD